MDQQMQLPILVPVSGLILRVRPEPFEEALVQQISARTGLSQAKIVRRCLRLVDQEIKRTGSYSILSGLPAEPATRRKARAA